MKSLPEQDRLLHIPGCGGICCQKATGGYPYGKDPGRIPGRIDAALSHCAGICTGNGIISHASACGSPAASRRTGDAAAGNGTRRDAAAAGRCAGIGRDSTAGRNRSAAAVEIDETSPEQPAIGWLQIITRSAGNARALAGVSVLVTNGTEEQVHLKHTAVTNESGETGKIPLPVPAASLSLNCDETRKPYSTYDVSVYADGFTGRSAKLYQYSPARPPDRSST